MTTNDINIDTLLAVFGHNGQLAQRTKVTAIKHYKTRTKITDSSGNVWESRHDDALTTWNGGTWDSGHARVWTAEDDAT